MSPSEETDPSAACTASSRVAVDSGQRTRLPSSRTSGIASGSSAKAAGSSRSSTNAPSRVTPTGTTS